jgi:hypothetical protein
MGERLATFLSGKYLFRDCVCFKESPIALAALRRHCTFQRRWKWTLALGAALALLADARFWSLDGILWLRSLRLGWFP